MRKNILLISLLFISSIMFAGERFARISSSDNTTPTPEGCAKVVFYIKAEKTARMTVTDSDGNEFYMESQSADQPPYFYFIPYGEYTVVKMEHIAMCCTAGPNLTVGSTFTSPNVGYFSMTYDDADPPITYKSFQRIPSNDNTTPTPEGCEKVIFAKDYSAEMVVRNDKGEYYRIQGGLYEGKVPYFLFIPNGTYKVISMTGISYLNTVPGKLVVGDTFYVGVSGHTSVGYFT